MLPEPRTRNIGQTIFQIERSRDRTAHGYKGATPAGSAASACTGCNASVKGMLQLQQPQAAHGLQNPAYGRGSISEYSLYEPDVEFVLIHLIKLVDCVLERERIHQRPLPQAAQAAV